MATETNKVVYLSTFFPRACGIATFTEDLTNAIDNLFYPVLQSPIVAMNANQTDAYRYPSKVMAQIYQDDPAEYIDVARQINLQSDIKLINVQHEFGIFGGEYGGYLILFLKALKKPAVITCHTVLPHPGEKLKKVVQTLAHYTSYFIVMTHFAKNILVEDYQLNPNQLRVIPHGIHAWPYMTSKEKKKQFGYQDKIVLSTFGFLSRGKGIEYVIEALPEVIGDFPNVVYCVFGMTHPNILKQEGESYRNSLIELARKLGVSKHVKFYNEYLSLQDLLQFLEMTDIYLSTSLNPNQAVSGTLSYALGMGRPVISTAFTQAREMITKDVGVLVVSKQASDFSEAILHLLKNPTLLEKYSRQAYFDTRYMTWSNVALQYAKVFGDCDVSLKKARTHKRLPDIKLDHIKRLTDPFAMFQFATFSTPNPDYGYTLDDNVRALFAVTLYYKKFKKKLDSNFETRQKKEVLKLIDIYMNFIEFVSKENGYFENYVNADKSLHHEANTRDSLEDSQGRAFYVLAFVATSAVLPKHTKEKAIYLLNRILSRETPIKHFRAMAFFVKGFYRLLTRETVIDHPDLKNRLIHYCNALMASFKKHQSEDWQWFEGAFTYANAVLPEALLLGYRPTKNKEYFQIANQALQFFIKVHFIKCQYVPIGQEGWYHRNGERSRFDQQPEDVAAAVEMLNTMYQVTHGKRYKRLMYLAFDWFLGNNHLEQMIYDEKTGGCYDGLSAKEVNLNQGAESTVCYLTARLLFE